MKNRDLFVGKEKNYSGQVITFNLILILILSFILLILSVFKLI